MRIFQSLHKGGHILGFKENVFFAKDRVAGLALKKKCMILPTLARPSSHQRGYWNFFMWMSLAPFPKLVLVGISIVW
jgi:hypothetical protein